MPIEKLANVIDPERISVDPDDLNAHRFDRWCLKHWQDWQGETLPTPGCIVRPESTEEVQALMRHAAAHSIAVIPWGLGSGVCGGIEPSDDQILLDMSAMNQVIEIDEENLLLTVQAGINGLVAEEAVAERGLTMGHWPQSIGISSVGGWVSTRASGQFSTAYGNIEDIVYTIDFVLASGEKVTLGKAPRAASGPDLRHLALGAEGTHGVVTSVTLSLRRQPASRQFSAWYCADMALGFRAQREIVQQDWKPPVMRQYDASEVARLFAGHERDDSGLILLVHEGPIARVEAEMLAINDIMVALGLTAADPAVAANWMEHRNNVPEWRDLLDQGLIADTIEVSGSWRQIDAIYDNVVAALKEVPDCVNASAHSSHVYRSGINLYFTFACMPGDTHVMGDRYLESWDRALTATAQAGGGIAHHHGSGRLRRQYLHHDLGEGGVELLRTVKNALDPQGILNPGNLLPPLSDQ